MNDAMALRTEDIGTVHDQFFTLRDFTVADGSVLPEARIVHETYGRLASDGRNVVLITHGYTGSHHAAGRNPVNGNQPGSWDGLIGPGKAIDTDRLFVVASNMLGSSFGSTNAASLNPATGEPYGPDFPAISIRDIVAAQKALLDTLGVKHLVAVAGPSYGGYQAYQWAVAYPDFMDAIVPVNTAPWASVNTDKQLAEVQARLATDLEWHGGRYYGKGGAKTVLTEIRVETLKRYGIEANLTARYPDPVEREAELGRAFPDHLAPRAARLRHPPRLREDQGEGALRAVPQRRLVPAEDRSGRHGGAREGRCRGALFRDRQRYGAFIERARARQMVAGPAGIPDAARRAPRLTYP
jgi:homoserine O-acetyltransferase